MSRKPFEQESDNVLLYKYIQLAYEYVARMSPVPIEGKPLEVLGRLCRQRAESLFGTPAAAAPTDFASFDHVQGWVLNECARRASDILVGRIDEIVVGADSAEAFALGQADHRRAFDNDMAPGGPLEQLGLDAYATYLPIHFFFGRSEFSKDWGVYISELGVARLAARLKAQYEAKHRCTATDAQNVAMLRIAYQILLRHELTHFRVESFALNAELILQRPLYSPYLAQVYAETYYTDACFEEALANTSVLASKTIRDRCHALNPPKYDGWQQLIIDAFLKFQPPGYRNYHLERESPRGRSPFEDMIVGHHKPWTGVGGNEIPPNKLTLDTRRITMNYLCNQITTGKVVPTQADIPFFAFFPDNYFLRAENLVPIHIVKSIDPAQSFLEFATPKQRIWEEFLRKLGYYCTQRGKGDHAQWDCARPGWGPIGVNYVKGELDYNAYKSALRTLGIKPADFRHFQTTKQLPSTLVARLNGAAVAA